jgi:hypothetical protein
MASPLARLNVIADATQSPTIDDGIRDLAAVGILIKAYSLACVAQ